MLHVTNGDCAATLIRRAGLPGDVIAWRDVLHEGPVPGDADDARLREIRARFLADDEWADYESALADFVRRDAALADAPDHDEVVLWFEHDLYDQLQLIQILDRFGRADLVDTRLRLICIGEFPGIRRFIGLGQLGPEQMASLFPGRRPVDRALLELGSRAWAAFRSADPIAIVGLLDGGTDGLPFLAPALVRHLEQFPGVRDGLSRAERDVFELISAGIDRVGDLFVAQQSREEAPFLGDTTFLSYLESLAGGPRPLLTADGPLRAASDPADRAHWHRTLSFTDDGREVLAGRADHVALNGIDRWFGGVHLVASPTHDPALRPRTGSERPAGADPAAPGAVWRWDPGSRALVAPPGHPTTGTEPG